MAKSELLRSMQEYAACISQMDNAESAGHYEEAIRMAKSAWQFVDDMMRHERKYAGTEFKNLPCIMTVLKLSPVLLDVNTLDELQRLLKSKKSIDKFASDDIAEQLADARNELREIYQIWCDIEQSEDVAASSLQKRHGGSEARWGTHLNRLEKSGLIRRVSAVSSLFRIVTRIDDLVRAKCSKCGAIVRGRKYDLLTSQGCPKCGRVVDFCILEETFDSQ